MNTKNVKVTIEVKNFEDMYNHAYEQFLAFNKVEGVDWKADEFSIDDSKDQMRLKQFLQIRFCEELAEATEDTGNLDHYFEEIADAFNFLLTAFIMIGKTIDDFPEWVETYFIDEARTKSKIQEKSHNGYRLYRVIEKAHLLCNLLKNRPWTQTQFLVSRADFEERLWKLWHEWNMYLADYLGIPFSKILKVFAEKKCVNMFRIETKY